jgi:hypothetical protein
VEVRHLLISLFAINCFQTLSAQVYHPNYPEFSQNHFKYLESTTTDYLHSFIQHTDFDSVRFKLLDPVVSGFYNSNQPFGYYDGSNWTGKGLTVDASLGFYGKWKKLEYSFFPRLMWSQNEVFDLGPIQKDNKSPYNYQYNLIGDIDYVQRYGSQSFLDLNLGQTEVRYRGKYFTTAVSNANFTLGPASFHSILLSRQAAGIPNIEIGTNGFVPLKPFNLDIGLIKLSNRHGILRESPYFDDRAANDKRYFSTLEFSYIPSFVPELKVGIHRVFYQNAEFFELKDLGRSFWYFTNVDRVVNAAGDTVNDFFDQMGAVYAEYNLSQSNARVYSQLVLNDFNFSRSIFYNTAHSTSYTLGFEKMFELRKGKLMFTYETSNIATNAGRAEPSYYMHYQVLQGYTQNGQLLGLGSGPASDVHTVSFKFLNTARLLEVQVQRAQIDEDFFNLAIGFSSPGVLQKERKFAEYLLNIRHTHFLEKGELTFTLNPSYQFNRYYIEKNDSFNLFMGVIFRYNLK